MDRTISHHLEDVDDELNVQFKLMVESLDLDRNGYTDSYCCDLLNEKLNYKIENRQVKILLIDYYGENIFFFTYPRDRIFFGKHHQTRETYKCFSLTG